MTPVPRDAVQRPRRPYFFAMIAIPVTTAHAQAPTEIVASTP